VPDLLDCTVMPYAWGSRTAIASLQGRPVPSPTPEAELWMGAHPLAPSKLIRDGRETDLATLTAANGLRELGERVMSRFGPRLPFLMKVLAADEPLSLQAHPTEAQARAGFEEEERRGIPLAAPDRNYKDPHHKPELLSALSPFDALCGFRRADETLALFTELAVPALKPVLVPLRESPDASGLGAMFRTLMTLPADQATRVTVAVVDACRAYRGHFDRECRWAVRLNEKYPGDRGIVGALMLNLVHLEPGEAIYLGAGSLHAYLHGVGIEIMAGSDNVLRGGLTPKHVDVAELLNVLDFRDGPVGVLRARAIDAEEAVWDTPAPEFRLSRIVVSGIGVEREVTGPEIVLCTEGTLTMASAGGQASIVLARGAAAFVAADARRYRLDGQGTAFRATTNLAAAVKG